jgi:hypothetical protein
MTYFHAVYPALSSALRRFTVLFGMGRRGPNALWSSENSAVSCQLTAVSDNQRIREEVKGVNRLYAPKRCCQRQWAVALTDNCLLTSDN